MWGHWGGRGGGGKGACMGGREGDEWPPEKSDTHLLFHLPDLGLQLHENFT